MGQISMFDGDEPLIIDKPIRLIELFAGSALWRISAEWSEH